MFDGCQYIKVGIFVVYVNKKVSYYQTDKGEISCVWCFNECDDFKLLRMCRSYH